MCSTRSMSRSSDRSSEARSSAALPPAASKPHAGAISLRLPRSLPATTLRSGRMRTRRLGGSDLEVTVVGLGCNNFGGRIDEPATKAVVDAALDAGITFFDTADIYGGGGGSETILGRILAGRRDQVVLATKFGSDMGDGETARGSPRLHPQGGRGLAPSGCQTDWIDLYQYHRPDGVTPLEETLGALDELVQEGKVRAIGSSNFTPQMVEEAHAVAEDRGLTPFASEQSQYSWLRREAEGELLPACERLGVGFIPYFPLASGLLTGKYRRGQPAPEGTRLHGRQIDDADFDRIERLEAFGARTRRVAPRGGDRRPGRDARRRVRDRRGDSTGAGARERGGRQLGADRRGSRRSPPPRKLRSGGRSAGGDEPDSAMRHPRRQRHVPEDVGAERRACR